MPKIKIYSKVWNPQVDYTVDIEMGKDDINIQIELNTFLELLINKLGSPTTWMTKAKLEYELQAKVDEVLRDIKETSKYVATNKVP